MGRLFSFLVAPQSRRTQQGIYLQAPPQQHSTAQMATLHLARLLPCTGTKVGIFWFPLYSDSRAAVFVRHLQSFLADTEDDIHDLAPFGWTLDFESSPDTQFYFENYIKICAAASTGQHILIVLDCFQQPDINDTETILHLVDLLSNLPSIDISLIWLGETPDPQIRLFRAWEHVELRSGVDRVSSTGTAVSPETSANSPQTSAARDAQATARFLPLFFLQHAAIKPALTYLMGTTVDPDVEMFVDAHLGYQLHGGGLALSDIGLQLMERATAPAEPTTPLLTNGARILSFVPPDELQPFTPRIKHLESLNRTVHSLSDSLVACLSDPDLNSDSPHAAYSQELMTYQEIFSAATELELKIIASYLGQVLMREQEPRVNVLFSMLERLVGSLAAFLLQSGADKLTSHLQASRLLTGVGYIFDKISERDIGSRFDLSSRRRIYTNAALALENVDPADVDSYIHLQYTRGWQWADSGDWPKASSIFSAASRKLLQHKPPAGEISGEWWRGVHFSCLAYIFAGGRIENHWIQQAIASLVSQSGLVLSVEELSSMLVNGGMIDAGSRIFDVESRVELVSGRFDLDHALGLASLCVFEGHIPLRLHIVTSKTEIDDICDFGGQVVVIGAPDTPEGVGQWITDYFPDIAQSYHLRLSERFRTYETRRVGSAEVTILGGCGLKKSADSRPLRLIDELAQKGPLYKTMEPFLTGVLSLIATKASEKLFDRFLDHLVTRIEAQLGGKEDDVLGEVRSARQELSKWRGDLRAGTSHTVPQEPDLKAHSRQVQTLVRVQLTRGQALEILGEALQDLEGPGLSPEGARDTAALLVLITSHLLRSTSLPVREQNELVKVQQDLRNLESTFENLLKDALRRGRVDQDAYNEELTTLFVVANYFFGEIKNWSVKGLL